MFSWFRFDTLCGFSVCGFVVGGFADFGLVVWVDGCFFVVYWFVVFLWWVSCLLFSCVLFVGWLGLWVCIVAVIFSVCCLLIYDFVAG